MKALIIEGSHRKEGNTSTVALTLGSHLQADMVSLYEYNIGHYEYDHSNATDDFIPLMKKALNYDLIILATPIYWYTMSGRLKVFMDRLSDCVQTHKSIGRALAGKKLAAICCGGDRTEFDGFFMPFALTAEYLDMTYLGDLHTWIANNEVSKEVENRLKKFSEKLKS